MFNLWKKRFQRPAADKSPARADRVDSRSGALLQNSNSRRTLPYPSEFTQLVPETLAVQVEASG